MRDRRLGAGKELFEALIGANAAADWIPGVGELVFFEDPAGNVAGAIQYARD